MKNIHQIRNYSKKRENECQTNGQKSNIFDFDVGFHKPSSNRSIVRQFIHLLAGAADRRGGAAGLTKRNPVFPKRLAAAYTILRWILR
jgi:hypothetical protein